MQKVTIVVAVLIVAIVVACSSSKTVTYSEYVDMEGYGLTRTKVECVTTKGDDYARCTDGKRTFTIEMSPKRKAWVAEQFMKADM